MEDSHKVNGDTVKYYFEIICHEENGFASSKYRIASFQKEKNAKKYLKNLNNENRWYQIIKRVFSDGDVE